MLDHEDLYLDVVKNEGTPEVYNVKIEELVGVCKSKNIRFATCGVPAETVKIYLKEKGYYNFEFTHPEESDYIIMTNRTTTIGNTYTDDVTKLTNCFDKFKGNNIFEVRRGDMLLSTIRKAVK